MFGGRYWGGRVWGGRYWGKHGFTAAGYFWGQRYWGDRLWGRRYWSHLDTSIPFTVEQTNTLGLTGAVTLASSGRGLDYGVDFAVTQTAGLGLSSTLAVSSTTLSYLGEEWPFTGPLELGPLAGTLTIAGTVTISAPVVAAGAGYWGRRYWGGRYFAPRYWATVPTVRITQTTGAALAGTLTTAATVTSTVGASFSTLGLTGALGVAASVAINSAEERSGGGRRIVTMGDSFEVEMREILEMLIPAFEMGTFNE